MAGTIAEVTHIRELVMREEHDWRGIRSFVCGTLDADNLARGLYDDNFPVTGLSDDNPQCYAAKISYHPLGIINAALVLAHYRTKLVPGRTIVRERIHSRARRAIIDLDGETVEGPDRTKATYEYQVIQGQNIDLESIAVIQVETAISAANYSTEGLWAIRECVNSSAFNIRGSIGAGKLLFKGFDSEDHFKQDPIPIKYLFWYHPDGWNDQCKSQIGTWIVAQMPTFQLGGGGELELAQDTFREMKMFYPGWKTLYNPTTQEVSWEQPDPESRRLFYTANFASAIPDTGSW